MIINWKYAGGGSGGDIALPIVVVDSLPSASAETMNKIYLVPNSGSSTNVKDEYITWLDVSTYKWEKIGTTDVDLTNYYTKSETDGLLSAKQTTNNLVTSIDAQSTDSQYPSAKCVYDIVGDVESVLTNIIGA